MSRPVRRSWPSKPGAPGAAGRPFPEPRIGGLPDHPARDAKRRRRETDGLNIHFNPPQLESARNAALLSRLVAEMVPDDFVGELRVLQNTSDESMRLVLIQSGRFPASLALPQGWLHADLPETEVEERLADLIYCYSNPTTVI